MNLAIQKIIKYSEKVKIEPSNVFFETNLDTCIVEYSVDKRYVRFINTLTFNHSRWAPLGNNNSSVRLMKKSSRYQVINKQRVITFIIWE